MKPLHWKLALIAAVTLWAIWQVWPRTEHTFANVKLGLDLRGGSYLVMQVQTDDAIKAEADIEATRIGERLRKEGFTEARAITGDTTGSVVVTGVPAARLGEAERMVTEESGDWTVGTAGAEIRVQMPRAEEQLLRDRAVRQALTTVQNRVDALGVAEASVTRLGGENANRLLVQMPGVEDPSRVKRVIQAQAQLELRSAFYTPDGQGPFIAATKEEVAAQLGGNVPPGVEILPMEAERKILDPNQPPPPAQISGYMAVEKSAVISGTDLQNAQASQGEWNNTVVSFSLRVGAADRFGNFTRSHIGKQMPIVLDGKIKSAPSIRGEIRTNGQIEGNFTPAEADELSLVLRAGALPARILTLEERTVGPSLGRDSIRDGLRAAAFGAAFTCLFMLVYYKAAGINAILALALNMLILFAAMAQMGATLTLPGIAGLALTVGMAVDANVLIFERIREELAAGKTVKGAVEAGFNKAFSAIFDSNVTTIIAALFLIGYGTGPVKGFAVTLIIGLLANMFTAVFASKALFELILQRPIKTLSI